MYLAEYHPHAYLFSSVQSAIDPVPQVSAKRKANGLGDTLGGHSDKRKCRSSTDAMFALSEAVDAVAGGLAVEAPEAGDGPSSPDRMTRAIMAVEDAGELDDESILDAISLFQNDAKASTAYLAIKKKDLKMKWLQRQLLLTRAAAMDFRMYPDA